MSRRKDRSFAVIGLGTFGSTVASELARFGNHVLGIDIDERNVARLADDIAEAIIADGSDEDALREAGVGACDVAVVAIGEDLEANVLCTMNVKLLGVPTVWVKATSRTHHRILAKLGVDRVIQAEREVGQHIAQMLYNPLVRDYVSLGNGFHIIDLRVPEELDQTSIGELKLGEKFEVRCLGLMRESDYISCHGADTLLETDDKLLLLGRRENLRSLGDSLRSA
ncbi:potassium channel family protein [Afifella aestuarii]|uniref:potassium channel family protein n=1 Tax=Afifella aestuarii TaxID=1909496 RepID=UPI000FE394C8|nr:TrkA family potassium uptake protein [Afifella aestuarii]